MKSKWAIALLAVLAAIVTVQALPARKVNLDYVRAVASLHLLRELSNRDVIFPIKAELSKSEDVSLVSGHAINKFRSTQDGLRINREESYVFSARVKSLCLEIEPGCVQFKDQRLLESVSVRVPM